MQTEHINDSQFLPTYLRYPWLQLEAFLALAALLWIASL